VAGAVALAVSVVAGAAGIVVAQRGPSDRARSRAAADRPCGRAYVEPEVGRLRPAAVALERLGTATQPVTLAVDPAGDRPTLLGEREGRVRVLGDDGRPGAVLLDLRDDTSDHGDGGLLALAYDPGDDWFYVLRVTVAQDDVVEAYPTGAGDLGPADGVELLRSGHPDSEQHHGGALAFGPDGMLYVGFGDGGGLGDPAGNAQRGSTLLGKLLRIDPAPGSERPYAVPPDNPFVGRAGWRPEIWALGLRNPYRLSFDEGNGDLWLGDVGQSCWEELNRLTDADAGANLGWDHREGTAEFEGGAVPGHAVWPEIVLDHRGGWCAVVAGYVVRDPRLAALDGWFLYSDYCKGRIMALRPATATSGPRVLDTGLRVERPVAVVEGPDGLPWVLGLEGDIGRIVPAP